MIRFLFPLVSISIVLTGCHQSPQTPIKAETDDLSLILHVPDSAEVEQEFDIKATIKNKTDHTLVLTHARPLIQFIVGGKGYGTEDIRLKTTLGPGETFSRKKTLSIDSNGPLSIKLTTTLSEVNGIPSKEMETKEHNILIE